MASTEGATSFDPLLAHGLIITSHALAACAALVIGTLQLTAPKGGPSHRILGYLWAVLMLYIAVAAC